MCARFTLTLPDYAALARALGVELAGAPGLTMEQSPAQPGYSGELYRPRYNAAPAEAHLVLRWNEQRKEQKRELVPARWGFVPRWAKDASIGAKLVNARAETARDKPAFRDAFAKRRCVVPADGFYEWTGAKGARRPFWFHPPEGGLLYLAGLYEDRKSRETGAQERTFTILTTTANELVQPMHDRMPVLLDRGDLDAWLGAKEATSTDVEALLRPAARGALVARRVSTRVNTVTADDPGLIAEVPDEEPPRRPREGETLPLFKLD